MAAPQIRYIPGDSASSFPRVQVHYPDSPLRVNVGETWVEWGTDPDGMTGCEVGTELDGGMTFRFHESNRHMLCDSTGIRVYDSDSEVEDYLILRLDHGAYHAGLPPVVGPAALRTCLPDDGTKTEAELIEQSKVGVVSYEQIMATACDMVSEHGENGEYDRAVYEFIANLFGIEGYPTYERMTVVEAEVRERSPVNPA